MSKKALHRIGLVFVLLVVAGGAYGWWYMAYGRWPFAGDVRHDFGKMIIDGQSVTGHHTFVLRNRRRSPVEITGMKPSCGCTAAELSSNIVGPGEELRIETSMSLSKGGTKRANIALLLADGTRQILFLEGVGVRRTAFEPGGARQVMLTRGMPVPVTLIAEIQHHDDEPGEPTVNAPANVDVTFEGWTRMSVRDPDTMRAAKWRGTFKATLGEGPLESTALLIAVGDDPPVLYRLSMRPESVIAPPAPPPPGTGP